MAKVGLSKLVMAKYVNTNGVITYTDYANNEKLASYSTDIEIGDDNNLYLDNAIAETEQGVFTTGTLKLETGDLTNETSKLILSIKENSVTIDDDITVKELIFDDESKSITVGVGFIEKHKVDGVEMFRAIVLPRVDFSIPADAAETQGETINWQTTELEGTIRRSEEVTPGKYPWRKYADCTTEAIAESYLRLKLGYVAPTNEG